MKKNKTLGTERCENIDTLYINYNNNNNIIIIIITIIILKNLMKKGYLEKFWNSVHMEAEEKDDLEIRGCRI